MQFENLHDLWTMSGHGPFVWSAYAIVLIVLAGVLWAPIARHRRFFAQQQQIERRRAKQSGKQPAERSA